MKVVISPAKKLDFESPVEFFEQGKPVFLSKTNSLATELKKLKANEIGKLMKLSANLSELNYERFQSFKKTYNPSSSKQAGFAFDGDTYTGLDITTLSKTEIKRAQKQLIILSGLYGALKPLDLIQPYRLEMGTKFKFKTFKNLYDYWQEDVTEFLNQELKPKEFLINCASNEYFNVIDKKILKAQIITPEFREFKNGEYKMISFFAKKARGMMARFIIQSNAKTLDDLRSFNLDGYKFNKKLSGEDKFVFTR